MFFSLTSLYIYLTNRVGFDDRLVFFICFSSRQMDFFCLLLWLILSATSWCLIEILGVVFNWFDVDCWCLIYDASHLFSFPFNQIHCKKPSSSLISFLWLLVLLQIGCWFCRLVSFGHSSDHELLLSDEFLSLHNQIRLLRIFNYNSRLLVFSNFIDYQLLFGFNFTIRYVA